MGTRVLEAGTAAESTDCSPHQGARTPLEPCLQGRPHVPAPDPGKARAKRHLPSQRLPRARGHGQSLPQLPKVRETGAWSESSGTRPILPQSPSLQWASPKLPLSTGQPLVAPQDSQQMKANAHRAHMLARGMGETSQHCSPSPSSTTAWMTTGNTPRSRSKFS